MYMLLLYPGKSLSLVADMSINLKGNSDVGDVDEHFMEGLIKFLSAPCYRGLCSACDKEHLK